MFLIDDLLMMPARGIMAVFREVHNAAQQDAAGESEAIRTELSELYMRLETQQISEAQFEDRERELLDRLDEIELARTEAMKDSGEGSEGDEDEEPEETEEDESDEADLAEEESDDEFDEEEVDDEESETDEAD
jgi:DNA-directed RNA polymerase delta subunit